MFIVWSFGTFVYKIIIKHCSQSHCMAEFLLYDLMITLIIKFTRIVNINNLLSLNNDKEYFFIKRESCNSFLLIF